MNATGTQTRISLKYILYATDFSLASEAALPYVKGLSKQYGATVHAVHVRFPAAYPVVGPEMMPQVIEAAEEQAKLEVRELQDVLASVPHDVSVGEGDDGVSPHKKRFKQSLHLRILILLEPMIPRFVSQTIGYPTGWTCGLTRERGCTTVSRDETE